MASKKRVRVYAHQGTSILDLGPMEIWDGTDLAVLRDTLSELVELHGCRAVGIDMSTVKYIPSGFFGLLGDWERRGVTVRLYAPKPHVQNMLWFRQFFELEAGDCYRLLSEPKHTLVPALPTGWNVIPPWTSESEMPRPATHHDQTIVS